MWVENVFPYTFVATVTSTFQGSRTNGSLSNYLCTLQLLQHSLRQTIRFLEVLYSASNPFRYERAKRRYNCFRFKSEMKYGSFKSTSPASEFICLSAAARFCRLICMKTCCCPKVEESWFNYWQESGIIFSSKLSTPALGRTLPVNR
jgi:hypothetical protein